MPSEQQKITAELQIGGEMGFMTRGCSMQPLFVEHRDIVCVRKKEGKFKRGDVVLYPSKTQDELILHRILRVKGDELIIRGDNNFFIERRKSSEIVGVMVSFFRNGKYCDISKSKKYKIYSFYILNSYVLRRLYRAVKWRLAALKNKILKKH